MSIGTLGKRKAQHRTKAACISAAKYGLGAAENAITIKTIAPQYSTDGERRTQAAENTLS